MHSSLHEAHEEHEVIRARGVRGHHFVPARGASEPRSHNRSFDSAERRIPSSCPSWLFQRSPVVNALSGEPFGNGALVPSAGCQITTRSTNVALTSRHSLPATPRLRKTSDWASNSHIASPPTSPRREISERHEPDTSVRRTTTGVARAFPSAFCAHKKSLCDKSQRLYKIPAKPTFTLLALSSARKA